MKLSALITWPGMDWRWRVILRWWLLWQAFVAFSVWVAWSTRPIEENLAILIGGPILSLWVPALLIFLSTPRYDALSDSLIRGFMIGGLTVVLWVTQVIMLGLIVVFAAALIFGH
jgi:hypothetical protein